MEKSYLDEEDLIYRLFNEFQTTPKKQEQYAEILFSLGGGVCLAILQLCVFRIAPEGVWQGGNASDPVYCCVGEPLQWKRDNSSIRPSPRRCSNQLGV